VCVNVCIKYFPKSSLLPSFTIALGFYVAGFLLIFYETRGLGNLVILLIFMTKLREL